MAHVPCGTFEASLVIPGRCGTCGWPEPTHQLGGDRVKTPQEIGERLSETFDPGGNIDYDIDTWATDHATSIDEARAILEAPLNRDISVAVEEALRTQPATLTPGEWCDLLAHQNKQVAVLLRRIESYRGIGLAATNTKDTIDPAMWRRFGLQISVDLPGEHERFAILRKYAHPFDFNDDAIDVLVAATRGCSPSLLRQLMEGMKRTLVLAPRLHFDVSRPETVFAHVISSIAPPPEMEQPPLWTEARAIDQIRAIAWPPTRVTA